MTNKITKKDNFNAIIALASEMGRTDLVEFAMHEIELLDKKATSKKPTKNQVENEALAQVVLETLATCSEPVTISELQKLDTRLSADNGISNQRVSAIMRTLVPSKVARTEVKGKAKFAIA